MMKKLIRIFAFLSISILLNAIPSIAQAQLACPWKTTMSPPPTIVFDPGVPNGTVLWKGDIPTNFRGTGEALGGYWCPQGTFNMGYAGTTAYLGGNLYETGIPGVAYRFKMSGTPPSMPCLSDKYFPGACYTQWGGGMYNHTLSVELIKTGSITAGGVLSGKFAYWYGAQGSNGTPEFATYTWSGGGVVVQPTLPTCKVSIPSIAVPLKDVNAHIFTGIGKTSSGQSFNITLLCSGGTTGPDTNIYVTLTDQTDPGNFSDTLRLTNDSTASGIGIQVLFGSTVIKYGPDSSAAGNKNQWKAGSYGQGTFQIPLTARYIQTASAVKPGKANGRATFTMSYQ
ncbi:fimbrial protein [Cupriavidus sp. PET2-C1]